MPTETKPAKKAAKTAFNQMGWRAADPAMRDNANLDSAGNPQVTSEAKNNLVHDGRCNSYDTLTRLAA